MKYAVNYFLILLMIVATGAVVGSCNKLEGGSFDRPPSRVSLYTIVLEDVYDFSLFRAAVDRAGLKDLLDGSGSLTVFAPTNGAFASAGLSSVTTIQNTSKEVLANIVKNHILEGALNVTTIAGTEEKISIGNQKILLQRAGNAFYADGGDITKLNVPATNGVMHVVSKLLQKKNSILEAVSANTGLTFLAAAITRASQGGEDFTALLSGPTAYTLFAPTNAAFTEAGYATIAQINSTDPATLDSLLKYHLLPGLKLSADLDSLPVNTLADEPAWFDRIKPGVTTYNYINGIAFSGGSANQLAGSGVIHIIPRILPAPITITTLERIQTDPDLTFLAAAITRADQGNEAGFKFSQILSGPLQSYTLYAPENGAFQAAGYATIDAINEEETAVITNILKFHLVSKRQNSINFLENTGVATLLNIKNLVTGTESPGIITITRTGGYKVKGPTNTTSVLVSPGDIVTTNGMINIIGELLLP